MRAETSQSSSMGRGMDTWLALSSRSRASAGKKRASFSLWPAAHIRSSCKAAQQRQILRGHLTCHP